MDRLSFVFSLLLILSVTTITFGSVIKAKNPNGESLEESRSDSELFPSMALKELGALLKRSHHQSNPNMKTGAQVKLQGQDGLSLKDQESEMSKRVDPETLIPGTITRENPAVGPHSVIIDIENYSGYAWKGLSTFFREGTEYEQPLPDEVPSGSSVEFAFHNQQGAVFGDLVYYIKDMNQSLSMAFSVGVYNLWSVATYMGNSPVSSVGFAFQMLIDSNVADDQWHNGDLEFVNYRVFMSGSPSPQANLKIQISAV